MIRKGVYLTQQEITRIQADADSAGISFAEMLRRIIDGHYQRVIELEEENRRLRG